MLQHYVAELFWNGMNKSYQLQNNSSHACYGMAASLCHVDPIEGLCLCDCM